MINNEFSEPKDAETKNEKLVTELADSLTQTTSTFINLNSINFSCESFNIVYNGSMGYLYYTLQVLTRTMNEDKILPFLSHVKSHLDLYIDQIKKDNNV